MKTKSFLLAAAFIGSGIAMLGAQDAPKPPPPPGGEGRPGGPPSGGDLQARFDDAFKKMDANGDGKVSKEEFLEFSKREAEDRFSKIDTTGSGSISKEQISEAMRRMRGGDAGQRRPEGFRRPEGDGGGVRPRPGGDNAPGGNPPPPPPEGNSGGPGGPGGPGMRGGAPGASGIAELFRKIQENGSVTKEEFTKMTEEQFKRMDANGDGKITKEEMEEIGRRMREMRGGQGGPPGAPGGPPQGGGEGGFRRRPPGDGAPSSGGDKPRRPESN